MSLDYRSILSDESARFAEVLEAGPLDAPVPSCPDWQLGDLGVHLVNVQRMGAHFLRTAVQGSPDAEPPQPEDAAEAVVEATAELLAVVDASDPDDACWNFFPTGPQTKGFWIRRQALEVVIHRWDAESAVSPEPKPIEPELAADVVDEYLHIMMPRAISRDEIDVSGIEGDVHLHCTDTEGEWTFEIADGELLVSDVHRKSAVAIRGSASDLALFAYNRGGSERVEIFGDERVLEGWSSVFRP